MPNLVEDLADLFLGTKSAHMAPHYYTGIGGKRWRTISENCETYSISQDEETLVASILPRARDIAHKFSNLEVFIDLGSGSLNAVKNKSAPLAAAFGVEKYHAVDLNPDFAYQAAEFMERQVGLKSDGRAIDYMKQPLQRANNAIAYMGGCSVGNLIELSEHGIQSGLSKELKIMANHIESGLVLATFDANLDPFSLMRIYNHDLVKIFASTPIENAINSGALKGVELSDFEFFASWDQKIKAMRYNVALKRDVSVIIGCVAIPLQAGQRFALSLSYKFTYEDFATASRLAGLDMVDVLGTTQSTLRMVVLSKAPAEIKVPARRAA